MLSSFFQIWKKVFRERHFPVGVFFLLFLLSLVSLRLVGADFDGSYNEEVDIVEEREGNKLEEEEEEELDVKEGKETVKTAQEDGKTDENIETGEGGDDDGQALTENEGTQSGQQHNEEIETGNNSVESENGSVILENETLTVDQGGTRTENLIDDDQAVLSQQITQNLAEVASEESLDKEEQKIIINEVAWMGTESYSYDEWVEFYNAGDSDVDLDGWVLWIPKEGKDPFDPKKEESKFLVNLKGGIKSGEYFLLERTDDDSVLHIEADQIYTGGLSDTEKENFYLINKEKKEIDQIRLSDSGWPAGNSQKGNKRTMERTEDGWQTSFILGGTPKARNSKKEDVPVEEEKESEFFGKVMFNEILSNPEGLDDDNEWVEILNINDFEVDLEGWHILNGASKKFPLSGLKLFGNGLTVIEIKNTSFSLRNTDEKLSLFDPAGRPVHFVELAGSAAQGTSFNFDGKGSWQWSRFITPGKENRLNNLPVMVIKNSKDAYRNMYAEFDAGKTFDPDGDFLKFRWDFGDGRRSYLKKTRHKYEENGAYTVVLRVDDGSIQLERSFVIEVKSFPKREVEIVKIVPNPEGKDSENELVFLKNSSSKKVDLKNWKIATGKDEDHLVNHPIYEEIIFESGETMELTREDCKFSLPNEKGMVRLLYPDGGTADEMEYDFGNSIPESASYELVDKEWQWMMPAKEEKTVKAQGTTTESLEKESEKFDWTKLTCNDELQLCENFQMMQVENWKVRNKVWLGIMRRFLRVDFVG